MEEVNSIMTYLTSEKEDWNSLSSELKEAIEVGLEQLDSGNKISYEEVKKRNSNSDGNAEIYNLSDIQREKIKKSKSQLKEGRRLTNDKVFDDAEKCLKEK